MTRFEEMSSAIREDSSLRDSIYAWASDRLTVQRLARAAFDQADRPILPTADELLIALLNSIQPFDDVSNALVGHLPAPVCIVHSLHECSTCHIRSARYDHPLIVGDYYTFSCTSCYLDNGSGVLGKGDTYLTTHSEVDFILPEPLRLGAK